MLLYFKYLLQIYMTKVFYAKLCKTTSVIRVIKNDYKCYFVILLVTCVVMSLEADALIAHI